jgi:cytochrome c nitrite reductase small subunit
MKILSWWRDLQRPMRYALAAMMGVVVGLGLYVARVSEAASYMSDDPRACINCHIMFPEYATWKHSSHANVANCNDCHVPHNNILNKYYFKAKDGLRHSTMFTLRLEPQVIQAIPESRKVIQENCIRCHANVMQDVTPAGHADFSRSCVDCHREVPHGRVHSLSSTPNAAVPELSPLTPEWIRERDQPNPR